MKEETTEEISLFIKNLNYSIIGGFFAAFLGIVFSVLAGRWLGPEEYGKYILINSMTIFLGMPMIFGIDQGLLKYNAEKEEKERRRKIFSTSLIIFFIFSGCSAFIFLTFSNFFSSIFSVSQGFFNLSVFLTFSLFLFTLSAVGLTSFHKIKQSAIAKVAQKVFILAFFLLFVLILKKYSYFSAVLPFIIASALVFIFTMIYLKNYIGLYFDKKWAVRLLKFSSYGVFSGIAGAISSNFDKVIINKFLSVDQIGLYGAYSAAFIVPIFFLFGMFNGVFYPTVCKRQNKMGIFRKVNKTIPLIFTFVLFFVIISGIIVFNFYGKSYAFNIWLAILFSLLGVLMCLAGIYGTMMGSVGKKGIRICTIAGVALMVFNVILDLLLIPFIGIMGAVISLIFSYIINIIIVYKKRDVLSYAEEYGAK